MQKKGKDIFIPGYILPINSNTSMDRSMTLLHKKRTIDEEDIITDVSEITNEINKISQSLENPEVGLKDATRLLKEIDEQMEMSFEIMEERQNMVRSYLIEREKEERSYKNRADKIMADFANKMDKLDVITSQIPIKIPICKASQQPYHAYSKLNKFSQTAKISVVDEEIQITADFFEEKSLKEVVEVLTAELQEVYNRQINCEKKKMHPKQKKKDYDIKPLSFFEFESLMLETRDVTHDVNAEELVKIFVNEEILNEKNEEFKVEMEREKKAICKFLVNDEDHGLQIKNDDLIFKLKESKKVFNKKIKEKIYMSQHKDSKKMNELRVSCRRLDTAEANYFQKITKLANEFTLDEDVLKNFAQQLVQKKDEQRNIYIDQFIGDLKNNNEKDENHMLENHFKELCFLYEEMKHNEEELNSLLFLKFTDKNRETLRNCLKNMKNFLSVEQDSESDSGIENPVLSNYANFNGSTHRLQDSGDNSETFCKKVGKNFVEDILKSKHSSSKVCDIIHYQGKFIEDILQDYSDEMEKVEENLYQVSAINEVNKVLLTHDVTQESADTLKRELINASSELSIVTALKENQKTQLETLKNKKDEKQTQNRKVFKNRNKLRLSLKALNKTIAGKLLAEKRRTISVVKANVSQLQKENDILDSASKDDVSKPEIPENSENNIKMYENSGDIVKNNINEEVYRLKNDLNKLSFYVDLKDSKECSSQKEEPLNSSFDFNHVQKVPSSTEVEKIIEQRLKLSEMLVKTEAKINNLLIQSSKFPSMNESSQLIENSSLGSVNNKLQLVKKLTSLENQLSNINYEISCEKTNFSLSKAKKELSSIKREMARIRKKLREKQFSQKKTNCKKQAHDTKLALVKNYSNEIIRDAMRELLQEKESTENIILHLNKDLENLKEIDSKMSQYKTCEEKLISVEKELLKKKEDCVIKMVAMAKDDHHYFIESLKGEIETKINCREKETQKLTAIEKEKLRNELCDIINDMKQTREQLKEIHQFQKMGHAKDNTLLTILSEKKKELSQTLNEVNSTLDKETLSQDHEHSVVSKLIQKKEGIMFQLEDLKERINNQEEVLKLRYKKLLEVKNELESKLFDGMSESEFRLIISEIENPLGSEFELTNLFKEKKQVQVEITKLLNVSPLNKAALQEASKTYENIDTLICTRLDEMMVNLHVDDSLENNHNLKCTLLLNPELFFGIVQHKKDLESTLQFVMSDKEFKEKISDETLVLGAQEIRQLEDIKFILDDFHNRNIESNHITDIIRFKSLNKEKIERLDEKIKKLTAVLDNQKTQNSSFAPNMFTVKNQDTFSKTEIQNLTNKNNNKKTLLPNLPPTDNISNLLLVRDDLLNLLFCVEKKLERKCLSTDELKELYAEKAKLEKEIDEIEHKVLNGDFNFPNNDLEFQLSSRSFSPKSTSSQASLSDVYTEREQFTKNLFNIKMKENESVSIKNWTVQTKEELKGDRAEISTKKDKETIQKKFDIDVELNELFVDNEVTLVVDYSKDCIEMLSDDNDEVESVQKMDILTLHEQSIEKTNLSAKKISSTSQGILIDEFLSSLSNTDDENCIENTKKNESDSFVPICVEKLQLRVLEKNKKEIESQIKALKHQNNSKKIEMHSKPMLVSAEVNSRLILEKCQLENEIESTRKKIEENEIFVRKIEALTELEFLKIEQEFTLEEHKENKVSLELQISIINSLIKNYACVIKNEILHLENGNIEQKLNSNFIDPFINENANALRCSKDHIKEFCQQKNDLNAEIKTPLKELLKERQNLVSKLKNIEKEVKNIESSTELQEITKDIRESFKAYKETIKKERFLQAKITVFEKKIADILEEIQCNVDVDCKELCRKTENENEEHLYKTKNDLKTENIALELELKNFREQFENIDKLKKEILKYKEEAEADRNSALLLYKENNEVKAQLEIFRNHLEENKEYKEKLQKEVAEQIDMNSYLLEENKLFKMELNHLTSLIQQEKENKISINDAAIQANDYNDENEKLKIEKENKELLSLNERLETKVKELEENLWLVEKNSAKKNEKLDPQKLTTLKESINNEKTNDQRTVVPDSYIMVTAANVCASSAANNVEPADIVLKMSEQNNLIKLLNQEKEELSEYLNQLECDYAKNINLLDSTSTHLRELKRMLGLNLFNLLVNNGDNETSRAIGYCGDEAINNEKNTEQIEILLQQNLTIENLLHRLLLEVETKTDEEICNFEEEILLKNGDILTMENNLFEAKDYIKKLEIKVDVMEKQSTQLHEELENRNAIEKDAHIKIVNDLENNLNLVSEAKRLVEEASVKDCEKISQLNHENNMLKQRNFYLEEKLDLIQKKEKKLCSEIEQLHEDLRNSEKKIVEITTEIKKINEDYLKLQGRLSEQITKNKQLRNETPGNSKIEMASPKKEVALQTQNSNDTIQLENTFNGMEQHKQDNAALNKTIDQNKQLSLNESTTNMQQDNFKTEDLVLKISEQNRFIENFLLEKDQLIQNLHQLEDDRAAINTRLDFNTTILRQLKQILGWNLYHVLTKDKQKNNEKDKYTEQIEVLLEQNSTVEDILHLLLIEVETRSAEAIQISNLEAEIQLKNAKIHSTECSLYEAKDLIKNLELNNETLEKHLKQLNDRVEYQNAKEKDVYIKMIDGLEKQLRMLSATNESMEETSARDHDKINQLNHENKMLTLNNLCLSEQVESLKKKEENLYSDIQRMRNDIQCLENKKNKTAEEQFKLQEKLKEISEENKLLRNQVSSAENADESAKSIARKLSVEMKKVKLELADSAADINSLTQENQQLKINNDNLCKKIQHLHKSKSDLQSRIDEQNKNLDALREEVLVLKESGKEFKFELRDKNDIVEEKEREITKLDKTVQDTEKKIGMMRQELVEAKLTHQNLLSKHQDECDRLKNELRVEKSMAEEMRAEIGMLTRLKEESDTIEKNLKNQNAENKKEQLQRESELLINLELEKKRNQELKDSLEDYLRKNARQEAKILTLKEENDNLMEKINNLDEKYEDELTDLRKTMNESFNANVDNLNKKLRKMASDYMQLDQINESLKNDSKKLTIDNEELLNRLNTQSLMHKEIQALDKAKIASLTTEIEGLRLENNDIKEKMDEMKLCLKNYETLNIREQELSEKELMLKSACQQLEEEKSQFTETIEKQLKKIQHEKITQEDIEKRNKDSLSLRMLASCQDQRDKLSEDLTKIKYELNNTKMELRKANLTIREKEQFYASEEKMLIKKYEEEIQSKIEELKKNASNDRALLIKTQNEERLRWEEEMKLLSSDLHEESLRKLAEQKVDFEKELQDQIFKFLHENSDEITELIAKNEQLQNEKKNLEKQMNEEKLAMIQEHARQHFVWEDTFCCYDCFGVGLEGTLEGS
ncbi:golgin subfamily B member 1 isoform X2 [Hydra vulgaris]|uniref:Golgin subfamily B member 1 isoform X2 n=1 Tax=Hydra vulgaris TaxID=6087 RepID=A0ABM4BCE8_HYDVU